MSEPPKPQPSAVAESETEEAKEKQLAREHELKTLKATAGLRSWLGSGDEKIMNIVFITLALCITMVVALIFLQYIFPKPDSELIINFNSLFLFLTNLSTLAFGYIFGYRSKGSP